MSTVRRLVERDGPRCWLCGNDVDLAASARAPASPSVDHVVPRARGGGNEPANLRLAHRACNGRRGSRVPELDWPRDVPVVDHTDIWAAVRRALRRPGEPEVVGIVVGDDAVRVARAWLDAAVHDVLGGDWEVGVRPVGSGLHALLLAAADPAPRQRGRRAS
ncbi:MAG: HNH endonuclease [Actinomycetes bacterium]